MAFPTNATVLDAFGRADESPLANPPWSTTGVGAGTNYLRIYTNQCGGQTAGAYNSQYYSSQQFGPDTEIYVDVPTWEPDLIQLYLRLQTPGSAAVDGYLAYLNSTTGGTIRIYRVDNDSTTQLAETTSVGFAAGDSFGFEAVGNILTAYHKPAAGSWSSKATYDITSDGTKYTGAGYVGVELYGNVTRIDNVSGGTVAAYSFQDIYPDADIDAANWGATPLYSKLNDQSDATVITETAG